MASSFGQEEISIEHRVDGALTDATSVVLSDSAAVYGIRNKSTLAILKAAGTASVNESTGIYNYNNSGNGIRALAAYDPTATYEYVWKITDTSANIYYIPGEFGPVADGVSFLEAYGRVISRVGRVGDTLAKELVNEALRFVANSADWPWKKGSAVATLTFSSGVAQYSFSDTSILEIYGGYIVGQHNLTLHDLFHFDEFNLYDRISGIPTRMLRTGRDMWLPDPLPDASYTAEFFYDRLLHLTDDGDTLPCPRDAADAIIDKAIQLAARDKGKGGLYRGYGASFNEKMKMLKRSRKVRKMIKPGDSDFMEIPVIR